MTDIRVAAEQARVALKHICTHSPRTPRVIDADWDNARAALASLEAALAALPGDKGRLDALTDALLAFEAEGRYLSHPAVAYHGTANGDDPKEWERRYAKAKCDLILRHSAATPAVEVPQIAGRDGASAAPSDEGSA